MRAWLIVLLAACANDGTRARCAEGGALTACADSDPTPEGACWRLVDCAAIVEKSKDHWDWGKCVTDVEALSTVGEQLAIDCFRSSTCDQLKVAGSPDMADPFDFFCWRMATGGGNGP